MTGLASLHGFGRTGEHTNQLALEVDPFLQQSLLDSRSRVTNLSFDAQELASATLSEMFTL